MARGDPNDSSWIITYSGKPFWPLEPREEDIRIEDIAHALSNCCRWTGHVKDFYSVGQHSIYVSKNVSSQSELWGLLHDASEAYLVDLARPIKYAPGLGEIYLKIEKQLEYVIAKKFGLPLDIPKDVKEADGRLLLTEKRDLMNGNWTEPDRAGCKAESQPYDFPIIPWEPKYTEEQFLARFNALRNRG